MTGVQVTADRLGPAFHHQGTGAVEGSFGSDHAFLKCHRGGDDLERGAGLVGFGDCLVVPHAVHQLGVLFGVVLGAFRISERIELRLRVFVDGVRIVEVEGRVGCHGKNPAGIHVHHDAGYTVARAGFEIGLFQLIFQLILDVDIQRGNDIIAVFRFDIAFVFKGHILTFCILRQNVASGCAFEQVVVVGFQTVDAHALGVGEPDHMGGKVGFRIVALGGGFEVDFLFQAELRDEGFNLLGERRVHVFLHNFVVASGLSGFFEDGAFVHIKIACQNLGDQLVKLRAVVVDFVFGIRVIVADVVFGIAVIRKLLVVLHLRDDIRRREDDVVHGFVGREDVAVAVEDVAALGCDLGLNGKLIEDDGLIVVMHLDLIICQTSHDHACHRGEYDEDCNNLPGCFSVGAVSYIHGLDVSSAVLSLYAGGLSPEYIRRRAKLFGKSNGLNHLFSAAR